MKPIDRQLPDRAGAAHVRAACNRIPERLLGRRWASSILLAVGLLCILLGIIHRYVFPTWTYELKQARGNTGCIPEVGMDVSIYSYPLPEQEGRPELIVSRAEILAFEDTHDEFCIVKVRVTAAEAAALHEAQDRRKLRAILVGYRESPLERFRAMVKKILP